MMGAGKTSLGRELSQLTGRQHLDTDHMLQQRLGRPIPQLFKIYGEATFREHETSILKSIETCEAVISTGGGIVLKDRNWDELKRIGLVIYVKVALADLTDRLSTSKKKRPLLQVEDWEEKVRSILEQREPLYERADVTVDISGLGVEEAAKRILSMLEAAS